MIILYSSNTGTVIAIVAVYIADILITGNDQSSIDDLKVFLHLEFKIKDLSPIHYFLGMEIIREQEGYIITQRKFTMDLLNEFDCSNLLVISSLLEPHMRLTADSGLPLKDPTIYRKLVGKLTI
uniref:Polypepetide with reverse transcriptase and RNaseH domains n=1 Tax=Solanum tuberosum TaxID=4113 RepID=M1B084_SOLTU